MTADEVKDVWHSIKAEEKAERARLRGEIPTRSPVCWTA
jgi:ATP diphosphatase